MERLTSSCYIDIILPCAKNADGEIDEKSEAEELKNLEAIKKLKELLDIGAVTREEFDAKKKQLLGI